MRRFVSLSGWKGSVDGATSRCTTAHLIFFVFFRIFRGLFFVIGGETMLFKEQVRQRMPTLTEAQLATLYVASAEEDRACAEAGMTEYTHGLCQEDAS
jgi:hypothetical protein